MKVNAKLNAGGNANNHQSASPPSPSSATVAELAGPPEIEKQDTFDAGLFEGILNGDGGEGELESESLSMADPVVVTVTSTPLEEPAEVVSATSADAPADVAQSATPAPVATPAPAPGIRSLTLPLPAKCHATIALLAELRPDGKWSAGYRIQREGSEPVEVAPANWENDPGFPSLGECLLESADCADSYFAINFDDAKSKATREAIGEWIGKTEPERVTVAVFGEATESQTWKAAVDSNGVPCLVLSESSVKPATESTAESTDSPIVETATDPVPAKPDIQAVYQKRKEQWAADVREAESVVARYAVKIGRLKAQLKTARELLTAHTDELAELYGGEPVQPVPPVESKPESKPETAIPPTTEVKTDGSDSSGSNPTGISGIAASGTGTGGAAIGGETTEAPPVATPAPATVSATGDNGRDRTTEDRADRNGTSPPPAAVPGQLFPAEPESPDAWKAVTIEELAQYKPGLPPGLVELLVEKRGIPTLGKLAEKNLDHLEGMSEKRRARLDDVLATFWANHPRAKG